MPLFGVGRSPFAVDICFQLIVLAFCKAKLQVIRPLTVINTLTISIPGFITESPYFSCDGLCKMKIRRILFRGIFF